MTIEAIVKISVVVSVGVLVTACGEGRDGTDVVPPPRDGGFPDTGPVAKPDAGTAVPTVAVLGGGTHDIDQVVVETIGTRADGLAVPRDVALNPEVAGEVWVVNRAETITVYSNAGDATQEVRTYRGGGGSHFLAQPSALAFGAPGSFATIHETDERTQGPNGTPEDFMGPTLWSADLNVFNAGHSSHLDMLHNSPNGMGIAWETGNTYWIFDGYHSAISRYAFNGDHGLGGADHTDGELLRYASGQVQRLADVPSHMELDRTTGLLYIADTGNNRIAVLDTNSGARGAAIRPNYDSTQQFMMDAAMLTTLVEGSANGLVQPSGLALSDGILYVTDNSLSVVFGFDLEGQLLDYLITPVTIGGMMGVDVDQEGRLLLVDAIAHEVIRISPIE